MSYFHRWEDFPKKINPKKGNSGEIVSTETGDSLSSQGMFGTVCWK